MTDSHYRHCGRKTDALDAYRLLASNYAPDWPSLHSFALSQALDIHAKLGKAKDVDWIRLVVAYLDDCTASAECISFLHQDRTVGYISTLITDLEGAAATLESSKPFAFFCRFLARVLCNVDCICAQHSSISINVSPIATISGAEDGVFAEVTIQNHLPCVSDVSHHRILY